MLQNDGSFVIARQPSSMSRQPFTICSGLTACSGLRQIRSVREKKLKGLDGLLLQLTAKGTAYDCVTRSFAPKLNVPEDPVCGSGHCHVIPLWAGKLKKDRVLLAGKAALYLKGEIYIPDEPVERADAARAV